MLSPAQVIPFLLHDDSEVRVEAAHYLKTMGDLAPLEASDQAWLALDRFGGTITRLGFSQSNSFLRLIAQLPPTDATALRTIERLGEAKDEDHTSLLNAVLRHQSPDFLAQHRTEWEPLASDNARKTIEARVALVQAGAEPLWQALVRLDEDARGAESNSGTQNRAVPIVEALMRYRDFASANAMEVLRDPRERWWLEIWSAEIVCGLRHSAAIDLLIEKMRDDEADFLRACVRSFLTPAEADEASG